MSLDAHTTSHVAGQDDLTILQRRAFGDVRIVERSCPLCGDPNDGTPPGPFSQGIWAVKTCGRCRFTYIDKAPAYEALFETMSWEKTTQVEEQWRNTTRGLQQKISKKMRWRLHILPRKRMPAMLARHARPGNVVDLGCGDGGQLAGLDTRFVPHGIEISSQSAAKANERFRGAGGFAINAPCVEGLTQFPDRYFTAATLRSYLEHELHPAEVLRALYRTLTDGGVAIVKVPNFASLNRRVLGRRWCGFRLPDHLNYFTPGSLRRMAQDCGYSVRFGLTYRLPTSDNMYAVLTRP